MLDAKYNFGATEAQMQKLWQDNGIFKFDENREGGVYSIDTPPPTVSGKLHIGHIFSYAQGEMIARYKRLAGFNVFYPFGFDDNGLPTERLVEREHSVVAKNLKRSEFIDICRKTASKYEAEFKALWQGLGFSVDWDLCYQSIDDSSIRISQKSFLDLLRSGEAYSKLMPVLWCTTCQTSIAQAELEGKESEADFNYIRFTVDGQELEIATTRPEMLFGCVAVFINPKDKRAKKLKGKSARVPLYDFEVPILLDEKADPDKGTGTVMCCTYGDTTDMEWVAKHNLPFKRVIENDGRIESSIPFIGGMKVKAARTEIVKKLEEAGALIKVEKIVHNHNTHERCGTAVEILPSKQYYINILGHKEEYLRAGDEINWYPLSMKNRYVNWVENLKFDWCVSRQRYFGVPFPLWVCSSCGKTILADDEQLPVNPLEDKPLRACECGSKEFSPVSDVMDTWATSSVSPLINARYWSDKERKYLVPMGMRTQAHEIIRTWAFYTIVKSLRHTGQIPWKDIMVCGFVLADKGGKEKISKSKGNTRFEPSELIKQFGADGLRYWAANNRLGTDTYFNEDEIKQSGRFMTKLWNASKFTLMQLNGLNKDDLSLEKVSKPLDNWLLSRFSVVQERFCALMDEYEIGLARAELDAFFWNDYCDYYLEIAKERMYQPEKHGQESSSSAKAAIYNTLLGMLKLYSIFTPHICEKIYQEFFVQFEKTPSIAITKIESLRKVMHKEGFEEAFKGIVFAARKHKTERGVSMKEPLNKITAVVLADVAEPILQTLGDLKACTSSAEIVIEVGKVFDCRVE